MKNKYLLLVGMLYFLLFVTLNFIESENLFNVFLISVSLIFYAFQISAFKYTLSSIFLLVFSTKFYIIYTLISLLELNAFFSFFVYSEVISYVIFYVQLVCLALTIFFNKVTIHHLISVENLKLNGIYTNFSIVILIIGFVFQLLHAIFRPVIIEGVESGGFGGFSNFAGISYLGLALYLHSLKRKNVTYLSFDLILVFTFAIYAFFSLVLNTKTEFALAILVFLLSLWAYEIKLRYKHKVYIVTVLLFFVFVLSPVIHATRSFEFRSMGVVERAEAIFVGEINNSDHRDDYSNHLLDRFDILSETNLVITGINYHGTVGYYPITDGLKSSLPGFLIESRDASSASDKIMWHIQEKQYGLITRTTIGIVSSLYAVDKERGVYLYLPVFLFLFIFILIIIVGNNLLYNPFSVFFVSKYLLFFTEKTAEGFIYLILRDLSFNLVLFLFVYFVFMFMNKRIRF